MDFILFGILAYLIGSIPTAVWIGRLKYGVDIREQGSKNAGATNTFRVLGKKAGIFVLSIDILKGLVAVLLPFFFNSYAWNNDHLIHLKIVAGIMAVVGHIFPIYVGFKGGKGVATSLGIIIGIHPLAAIVIAMVFLIVFITSNYVSLSSICAATTFPIAVNLLFHNENMILAIFSIVIALTVVSLHHQNIKRLLQGNESKMNLFKKKS